MERTKIRRRFLKSETIIAYIAAVALAFVFSPIVGFIGEILWGFTGGAFGGIIFIGVGIAAFVLLVWKSPPIISKLLVVLLSPFSEPIRSSVGFAVSGAFIAGGMMLGGILSLGHMRPESLDWDHILPAMGISFVVCFLVGWPVGLAKRRKQQEI